MEEFLALFVNSFAPVVGTIAVALVSWGTVELTKYVRSKTKSEAANNAVLQICQTAKTVVAELNQTMVPAFKKAAADGKLTEEDGALLKKLAMQKVDEQIPGAIEQAAKLTLNSVTALIESRIEKSVGDAKK